MPTAGGKLLELTTVTVAEDGKPVDAWRLWVLDTYSAREPMLADEVCVYSRPVEHRPRLGVNVWWYSNAVFVGDDGVVLDKVWSSHPAPGPVGEA